MFVRCTVKIYGSFADVFYKQWQIPTAVDSEVIVCKQLPILTMVDSNWLILTMVSSNYRKL